MTMQDWAEHLDIHLLSGIVKCPICGVGMYGNKSIKHKADGSKYKDFYHYGCKHRTMTHGHRGKRQLMESLISEIQIYEERQPNGQWLKSIKFKLPIIADDMSLSLDNDAHIETVALMSKKDK